jgi:hypothetical protein
MNSAESGFRLVLLLKDGQTMKAYHHCSTTAFRCRKAFIFGVVEPRRKEMLIASEVNRFKKLDDAG